MNVPMKVSTSQPQTSTVLALDARPAQRPPHSFRRLLELFYAAACEAKIPAELWIDGPLHPECEHFAKDTKLFPSEDETKKDTVMWCLTADKPLAKHDPYISMICDINPLLPDGRSQLKRWKRARAFRTKVDYAIASSWRIATDSEDARTRLVQAFPAIESKLCVVPLFAAPSLQPVSTDAQTDVLQEAGLEPGYIFCVGSFRRHKNWRGLMHSYALLPDTLRSRHPLVFSGAVHRDMPRAQKLIEELNLRNHVSILGETPESHLPTLYSAASLFVFPSYMEGFGLPPLEAMQCGTPVVASRRTSIPEVLGEAARYFDPDDPQGMARVITDVLEEPELQQSMVEAGFIQAASFGAARTGQAIARMLDPAYAPVDNST